MNSRKPKAKDASKEAPRVERAGPALQREMIARALLKAIDAYIDMRVARATDGEQWVNQNHSPLGKRAHLQAVRRGQLEGVKHGKRVLVRRSDLNSYLAKHSVKHSYSATDSGDAIDAERASEVAAQVLTNIGLRQRRGIEP
jgi:hypothetical protein